MGPAMASREIILSIRVAPEVIEHAVEIGRVDEIRSRYRVFVGELATAHMIVLLSHDALDVEFPVRGDQRWCRFRNDGSRDLGVLLDDLHDLRPLKGLTRDVTRR